MGVQSTKIGLFLWISSLVVASCQNLELSSNDTTTVSLTTAVVEPLQLPEGHRGSADKASVPRKGADLDTDLKNDNPLLDLALPLYDNSTITTNSSSVVPRKGAVLSKEPSKPRKGVELKNNTIVGPSNDTRTIVKLKPLYLGNAQLSDNDEDDNTPLTIGLSVGVALIVIVAVVSFWRLREVWAHRQYKRVDFLINGLYVDA